jgi:hypothetical protein
MTANSNSMPQDRNLRQTIEGMPLIFNAAAASDLTATIQFNACGGEPGVYHLRIGRGDCIFHRGAAPDPTLTINTPSEVWLQLSNGQISGCPTALNILNGASSGSNGTTACSFSPIWPSALCGVGNSSSPAFSAFSPGCGHPSSYPLPF